MLNKRNCNCIIIPVTTTKKRCVILDSCNLKQKEISFFPANLFWDRQRFSREILKSVSPYLSLPENLGLSESIEVSILKPTLTFSSPLNPTDRVYWTINIIKRVEYERDTLLYTILVTTPIKIYPASEVSYTEIDVDLITRKEDNSFEYALKGFGSKIQCKIPKFENKILDVESLIVNRLSHIFWRLTSIYENAVKLYSFRLCEETFNNKRVLEIVYLRNSGMDVSRNPPYFISFFLLEETFQEIVKECWGQGLINMPELFTDIPYQLKNPLLSLLHPK